MTSPQHQTAVFGVSGYAGAELARLLLHHPRLRGQAPLFFGRPEEEKGARVALTDLHPQLADNNGARNVTVDPFHWDALAKQKIDVVFLATPHEQSRAWVPKLLQHGVRVIDLSGAWRLDEETNRAIYKLEDHDPAAAESIQQGAVYGLPELHRKEIAKAKLVANPDAMRPLSSSRWLRWCAKTESIWIAELCAMRSREFPAQAKHRLQKRILCTPLTIYRRTRSSITGIPENSWSSLD